MNTSREEIIGKLRKTRSHVTEQRIAVMEYLESVKNHPTAKEIYNELKRRGVKISRASVFNVLRFLRDQGLIREIKVADENHYDARIEFHPHFLCKVCGRVLDLDVSDVGFYHGKIPHKVEQIDLIITGVCQKCLKKLDTI
ncbi:MAG: transcriptional repressor [Thermotogae bacterium]|nr:transcriptional repressor [Thermotogota bacterium]